MTSPPRDGAARTLQLSRLLDLHLSRAIARHGSPDMTSKLKLAAQMIADRKKALDERAQALIDKMPGFDARANQAFEQHEGFMAAAEKDFSDMSDMLRDLEGGNNPPADDREGSAAISGGSFPAGER